MCEATIARIGLRITCRSGSLIAANRQYLAEQSLGYECCSHLLFLDDDMLFPADTLMRMLSHSEPIVGVNYRRRQEEVAPVAVTADGQHMGMSEESTGLVEGMSTGTGIMLIALEVFRALPKPWFETHYDIKTGQFVGEDRYFCHKAAEFGYKTMIDLDLSREVVHVGSKHYGWQLSGG